MHLKCKIHYECWKYLKIFYAWDGASEKLKKWIKIGENEGEIKIEERTEMRNIFQKAIIVIIIIFKKY